MHTTVANMAKARNDVEGAAGTHPTSPLPSLGILSANYKLSKLGNKIEVLLLLQDQGRV